MVSVQAILDAVRRPLPYETGAGLWTHPHIAAEMLRCHLSPETDAASYKPAAIDAICAFLRQTMQLSPGDPVVDLGCGPGLYCRRLADQGLRMTGIDQSANSLRYAAQLCKGRQAEFRHGSYLEPFGAETFAAALLISQDYGVLSPDQRETLLGNIRAALRPGGRFALDVSATAAGAAYEEGPRPWEAAPSGFWRAHPYLLLPAVYRYPELNAACNLYAVADEELTVYRVWQTFFSVEALRQELAAGGFTLEWFGSGLTGEPWREGSPVLAAVCRRA